MAMARVKARPVARLGPWQWLELKPGQWLG